MAIDTAEKQSDPTVQDSKTTKPSVKKARKKPSKNIKPMKPAGKATAKKSIAKKAVVKKVTKKKAAAKKPAPKKRKAKKQPVAHITKAQAIRDSAQQIGKRARPKDIIAALAEKGITVVSAQVSHARRITSVFRVVVC